MLKEAIRDYATEAFRFWAFVGGVEAYKARLLADIQQPEIVGGSGGPTTPTESAAIRAEERLESAAAAIADLEAVERTMDGLEAMQDGELVRAAVEEIYMAAAHRKPERGEIQARVTRFGGKRNVSERNVYRCLRKARILFAVERGLRYTDYAKVGSSGF